MPHSLQDFLADATITAATNLETALLRLPEEKRNWKAAEQSRSDLDQVAECAIMNNSAIEMIRNQNFPNDWAYLVYHEEIVKLCDDWPRLQKMLHENAAKVADAIRAVTEEDLKRQPDLADSMSYLYWNMSYHEGQINFIASMLGCLD